KSGVVIEFCLRAPTVAYVSPPRSPGRAPCFKHPVRSLSAAAAVHRHRRCCSEGRAHRPPRRWMPAVLPLPDPGQVRIASRYRRREGTRGQSWPVGYPALDLGQFDSRNQADARAMTRIDWTHALSLAATLVLAIGAIYILLFAMF